MADIKKKTEKKTIFGKSIPLYFLLISIPLVSVLTYIVFSRAAHITPPTKALSECRSHMDQVRQGDYKLTRPLLLVDIDQQSDEFTHLKNALTIYIKSKKDDRVLSEASLYIRDLNSGAWTAIGDGGSYSPGSMLKIARLIATLKEAESKPGYLDKRVFFSNRFSVKFQPVFPADTLIPGRNYSIRELLHQMIVYSDNDATILLNQQGDLSLYLKLFVDLGLPEPDIYKDDYPMSIVQCSRFMRVLYNSTYLSAEMSEFALSLLTQSAFRVGIVKYLDPNILVAHKFGERSVGDIKQLHEMAIVYSGIRPYFLGVMTKGWNYSRLPEVLSEISEIVQTEMSQLRPAS